MRCLKAVSLCILGVFVLSGVTMAQSYKVVAPGDKVEGKTLSDFAAEWWKWAQSVPEELSPVDDETGRNCAVGQSGAVWFLAGGYGSSRKARTCEVPAGRYIFFPVINGASWRSPKGTLSCDEAKRRAAVKNEDAIELYVEIDGSSLTDVKRFRARTDKCFNVYERVPSELGAYDAYPSATDGYWIMLEPLSEGRHVIKFGGRNKETGRMIQDITYKLTIK